MGRSEVKTRGPPLISLFWDRRERPRPTGRFPSLTGETRAKTSGPRDFTPPLPSYILGSESGRKESDRSRGPVDLVGLDLHDQFSIQGPRTGVRYRNFSRGFNVNVRGRRKGSSGWVGDRRGLRPSDTHGKTSGVRVLGRSACVLQGCRGRGPLREIKDSQLSSRKPLVWITESLRMRPSLHAPPSSLTPRSRPPGEDSDSPGTCHVSLWGMGP